MNTVTFPKRYVPKQLTRKDTKKQIEMLLESKKMYKQNKYYTRKKVSSYKHIPSKHLANARNIYHVQNITPNKDLAQKTGCSLDALQHIVKKGQGAYYSSGSRPNQTPQSWGIARLASAITSGKASAIDYDIIHDGCNHKKMAYILANKARKKYKYGHSHTPRKTFQI